MKQKKIEFKEGKLKMADKRFLQTGIWTDNKYFAALTEREKVLFLYLWSNRDVEYFGVMDFFPEKIAHETRIKVSQVIRSLEKFAQDGVIIIEQYKMFVHGFVKLQGPVNPRTLNRFRAEKHKLPPKIRKAAEVELEGGSGGGSQRGSESSSQSINNNKELMSNTELLSEKEEYRNFENNNSEPAVDVTGEKEIQTDFQHHAGEEIDCIQHVQEDVPLTDVQRSLVERIARSFKDTFGWNGDAFDSKVSRHFVAAAQRIAELASDTGRQDKIIGCLVEALKSWSITTSRPQYPKVISPGHLSSDFTWATVLPQYVHGWMTLEKQEQEKREQEPEQKEPE
jgi:hypothetical protein